MLKGLRHVPRPDAASGLSDAGMASPFGVLGVTLATPNALPSSLPPPYSPPTPSLLLIPSPLLPLLVYIFILLFLHTPYSSLSRSSYFTLVQIFLFLLKIIICITRILLPSSYCLVKIPFAPRIPPTTSRTEHERDITSPALSVLVLCQYHPVDAYYWGCNCKKIIFSNSYVLYSIVVSCNRYGNNYCIIRLQLGVI